VPPRLIVIGGGPIGIAAAVEAVARKYDVTVLEAGEPGEALRTWGSTRFFSPLAMNVTPRMRAMLNGSAHDDDALMSGPEFVDAVLLPIAAKVDVKTAHRVIAVGRRGFTREDYAGHPLRAERPFRLLVSTPAGERTFESEIVLDATGGFRLPRAIGAGGIPAAGESALASRFVRSLSALERMPLAGKRVIVVGNGHSAANALAYLAGTGARVVWIVRTANRRPCEEVANDPLPERRRIVSIANDFAQSPPAWLTVERRATIERITDRDGVLHVSLTGGRTVEGDVLAAFTGYRPDASILTELGVEISPVTEGGARLHRAISGLTDCLAVPAVSPRDLESGEPNFYFIGSRAYGRARTFLLRNGLQQLRTIFEGLPR
jgi:thioredoxin reductase